MSQPRSMHRSRRLIAVAAALAAAGGLAIGAPTSAATSGTTTVWVPKHVCASPARGAAACDALRLVKLKVKSTSPAAQNKKTRASQVGADISFGPSGGYTPGDLASAYGVNAASSTGSKSVVAIVDAFNDPTVGTDLNTFDTHYGLPSESSSTFRVVNQAGDASPLPPNDTGWAGEITLDVQAVRGLCHSCKILLVEANSSSFDDLAIAENAAAAYTWTVGSTTTKIAAISNSYGGPDDGGTSAGILAAYDHPHIAVLASTGDDGWFGWDVFNNGFASAGVSNSPASFNTVVGVGGTSLYLNSNGTRAGEQVWNSNGPTDFYANNLGQALGAAGGGCSDLRTAKLWQSSVSGYAGLGCDSGMRSETDVAAVADPFTGYDVFQTFGGSGWETFGGTSLASPVVAAMWGLAGGPGGVSYPALSLYGHFKSSPSSVYDVTIGGTGLCSTSSVVACGNATGGSPNALGAGPLDCAFPWSGHPTVTGTYQCYARPGYDGVSGVGTPRGTAMFKALNPTAVITKPSSVTHGHAATFKATKSSDPFPGGALTSYKWTWGDGHSTTTTHASVTHTYAHKGKFTVKLTVTDNYGRTSPTRSASVSVG